MEIIIANNSEIPIYEQIKKQIKTMIMSGELKEGEALPSMRVLAKELRISIITTKRAYEDLEREGYIDSFTGKGSFVKALNKDMIREQLSFEIEELFESAVAKSRTARISYEELAELLRICYDNADI